ncbi:MAG: hypothetical protein AAFV07_10045 [Bacteroidota bacterium]
MNKVQVKSPSPVLEQTIVEALINAGKFVAIKRYIKETGCRLTEARIAVDRISENIMPGQASM